MTRRGFAELNDRLSLTFGQIHRLLLRAFKKQAADGSRRLLRLSKSQHSGGPDVFGSRPLGALSRVVGNPLPFTQFVETDAFDVRRVEEHVFVRSGFNKPEASVRQPFDLSLCHTIDFLKNDSAALPDMIWSGHSAAREHSNRERD